MSPPSCGGGNSLWRRQWRHAPCPARCAPDRSAARREPIQRLAETGDIAMPEDREDAAEQRHGLAVDDGLLPVRNSPAPAPWSGGWCCRSLLSSRRGYAPRATYYQAAAVSPRRCQIVVSDSKPLRHVGDGLLIGHRPASQPRAASAKIVRPTAKPLTRAGALRAARSSRSRRLLRGLEPEQDHAAAIGIVASRSPRSISSQARHWPAARASTSRASARRHRARPARSTWWSSSMRAVLAGDDLDQQFAADLAGGVIGLPQLVDLLAP